MATAALAAAALAIAGPLFGGRPATAASPWPNWQAGPGLKLVQPAGSTAVRLTGRATSSVLAWIMVLLKQAPPTSRLVFKTRVVSRTPGGMHCLRLQQRVIGLTGRVIARGYGPWVCLKGGESAWLWIEYRPTVDADQMAWMVQRRSSAPAELTLDFVRTDLRGKDSLLPRVRNRDPLPPGPIRTFAPPPGPALPLAVRLKPGAGHPRLIFTPAGLARYRRLIQGPLLGDFARLKAFVDRKLNESPPTWPFRQQSELHPWVLSGYRIFVNAGMYLLTGQARYERAALMWARAAASWPEWGVGEFKNNDLGAAHLLYGLALAYDWLYAELTPSDRTLIRDKLVRQATLMYRAASTPHATWWNISWRQNHLWINYAALGVAGLALMDEVPQAERWVRAALGAFQYIAAQLPADGSYHEGVGYWRYAVEHLAVFFMALRSATGLDPWPRFPWLKKSIRFRLHHMRPDLGAMINFGDSPEVEGSGAQSQLYILARAYRDPTAQWLARVIDRATENNREDTGRLWTVLGDDPGVTPREPDDRPPFALFDDLGLFIVRSDWGPDAALLAFKCGPPGGRKNTWTRINGFRVNLSHSHPDQNSLLLFVRGRLALADDGYSRLKMTRDHNTLIVDGRGQRGEGHKWYYEDRPRRSILTELRPVLATPFISAAQGEAAPMYPSFLGLDSFRRLVIFLPPGLVLVADDVSARRPVVPRLLFHFRGRLSPTGTTLDYRLTDEAGTPLLAARFFSPARTAAKVTPDPRPVIVLAGGRVTMAQREHAILSLGPPAPTGRFRLLSVLAPWAGGRPITAVRAVNLPGAYGASFVESGRDCLFLARTGSGTMAHGPFKADARVLFAARDQKKNLVAAGLGLRRLNIDNITLLEADQPLAAALYRRSQVMIVLVESGRARQLTLTPGFTPARVSLGPRDLPLRPEWKQGRITLDLPPGKRALIIVSGPRAPRLPPVLSPVNRAVFFLAQ
jgi:hypothetical protein